MKKRKLRTWVKVALCVIVIATISLIVNNEPKMVGYDLYCVSYGDTLWSVAEQYKPRRADIREFVYELAENNGISDYGINVGDVIKVPIYE